MVAMRLAFIVSDTKRMTGFQRNVLLLQETSGGRTSTTSSIHPRVTDDVMRLHSENREKIPCNLDMSG